MPSPKTTILLNQNQFIMDSLILSEFESSKLSVDEMRSSYGGCTSTRGASTADCAGDSDSSNRDSCSQNPTNPTIQ